MKCVYQIVCLKLLYLIILKVSWIEKRTNPSYVINIVMLLCLQDVAHTFYIMWDRSGRGQQMTANLVCVFKIYCNTKMECLIYFDMHNIATNVQAAEKAFYNLIIIINCILLCVKAT